MGGWGLFLGVVGEWVGSGLGGLERVGVGRGGAGRCGGGERIGVMIAEWAVGTLGVILSRSE